MNVWCTYSLLFVVAELTMVQSIPEGRKAKPSKTSCSENRSEPDCEWACHVPPSLWRRDMCIWTDSGPKPTRLLSLLRRRLSEMVDDRFIQKWPTIGYLNLTWASNMIFFLLHLAWSTIQLWSPNFSLVLLDVAGWHEMHCGILSHYKSHLMPTGFMTFHKSSLHVTSPFLHTSQAVVTAGSHMRLKRWSVFPCYSGVLGGSRCYFKETPAGLTTGWQHLLTVICSHAGCENSPTCGKITHYC